MKFLKITAILLLLTNQVWSQSFRFDKMVTTAVADKSIKPVAIVISGDGSIYFSDESHVIYKTDEKGNPVVLAGTVGKSGFADGPATEALFSSPAGLYFASEGGETYLYVADYGNNRIRRVSITDGTVSTVIGDGSEEILNGPYGITQDYYSNYYVSEAKGHKITRFYSDIATVRLGAPGNKKTENWIVETYAGSTKGVAGYLDETADAALFDTPLGIIYQNYRLYIADSRNNRIRYVQDSEGYVTVNTLAGSGEAGTLDGVGSKASFSTPCGLAGDGYSSIYVTDMQGHDVRVVDTEQGIVSKYAGNGGGDFLDGPVLNAKFNTPMGLATFFTESSGTPPLYIADNQNSRIREILDASTGKFTTTYGSPSDSQMVYVSGENLLGDLIVTSDYGFEIADSPNGPYSDMVRFSPTDGNIANKLVYIRIAASTPVSLEGGISTDLRLTSEKTENVSYLYVYGEVLKADRILEFKELDSIAYSKGGTFTLNATAIPATTGDEYITFSNTNPYVNYVYSSEGVGYGYIYKPGIDTITATLPANANYNEVSVKRQLIITKIPQTITFDSLASKTYGDAAFPLAATSSSGLNVVFSAQPDTIIQLLKDGKTVSILKPGIAIITANQFGNDTIAAAPPVSRKLVIEKASQSVSLGEFTNYVTYGDGPIQLSAFSSAGLSPFKYFSSDESIIKISGDTAAVVVGAGEASIWAYQEGNDFYKADTSAAGIITVNKADQSIKFPLMAVKNVGDAPFLPGATASSGLAVSYSSENQAVAIVSGDTIKIVGAGTSKITASQAGNKNYNPAKDSVLVLKVRSSQTITIPEIGTKYYGDAAFTLPQFTSAGLTIIYTSSDNKVATVSGNVVTIVGLGVVTITANQPGDGDIYGPAKEVKKSFLVRNKSLSIAIAGASIINIGEVKEYRVVLKGDSGTASNVTYHYDWFYVKNTTPPVFTPALTDQNRFVTSDGSKVKVSFPSDFGDSKLAAIVSYLVGGTTGEEVPFDTIYYNVVINKVAVPSVSCTDSLGCSPYKISAFEYAGVALNQKTYGIECPAGSLGYSDFATAQYLYDSLGKSTALNMKVPKLFTSAEMYVAISGDTAQYYGFWLDSDANGSFGDPGEFLGGSKTALVTYKGKLAIPNNEGASGTRRLRVKSSNAPLEAGSYCIVDKNRKGETEDYLINLEPYPELKAPEAFTPGTDGYNDVFIIRGIDPARSQKSLKIYDQFGREVYAQEDYDNRWGGISNSGEMLPNGTYFYEFSNGDRKISGFIEIVAEGTVK